MIEKKFQQEDKRIRNILKPFQPQGSPARGAPAVVDGSSAISPFRVPAKDFDSRREVTEQNSESVTLCNIPEHDWSEVTEQSSENVTLRNIVEHGLPEVARQGLKGDMT